ncbi:MAG: IS1634 family transposase [Deltaproteobacteria bacterium]|nr:IS1634 family transposase [Deltaproteobacteria bacterium]
MFIRAVRKQNRGSTQVYFYHQLIEAVRTPRGPRQRILLNLGTLEIPPSEWKELANRIEELYLGQQSLSPWAPHLEALAQHYASLLRQKEFSRAASAEPPEAQWETVDLASLHTGECRTLGGEAVAWKAFQDLGFPQILEDLGFSQSQLQQAALLIIGRLLHPASERQTALWAQEISALGELLGADFRYLSNNALYRLSDLLVAHRGEIETRLADNARKRFSLGEKIILYDLTNTYLTGRAHESRLGQRGHSKEKRKDRPLLTLALVLDGDGFPKTSRVFPGNVSEPGTLAEMLRTLRPDLEQPAFLFQTTPTVIIDAGIATAANLAVIQEAGFHYVAVSRNRTQEIPQEGLVVIKETDATTIQVKRLDQDGEILLYCHSSARARKEAAMRTRMQQRFEEGLQKLAAGLTMPRGCKNYDKILGRLGRLRERYPTVAPFYDLQVHHRDRKVQSITWEITALDKLQAKFSGSYYLRSNRQDLTDQELWSLYMMLTQVEEAFRALKSELGLRPVYHRRDRRLEGHLFITVLAYHLLAAIQRQLKRQGLAHRWQTIRTRLATQMRVTVSLTNDQGERLYLRQTTDPEPFHLQVYRALGLPPKPLKTKKIKV